MYKKNTVGWAKHIDFILLDEVCVALAFFLAYWSRHVAFTSPFASDGYDTLFFVILVVNFMVAITFNTFSNVLKYGYYKTFLSTLLHVALVFAIVGVYLFSTKTGASFSRIAVYLTAGYHIALSFVARCIYKIIRRDRIVPRRSMLAITTADYAEELIGYLTDDVTRSYKLSGIALVDADRVGQQISGVEVKAGLDTVEQYVCREWIDEVFLHIPRDNPTAKRLYESFMSMGVTVHLDLGTIREYKEQHQQVERIGKCAVLTSSINYATPIQQFVKRTIDILGGIVGSILALIILAIVAWPIKKQSPGPLIYAADRIGLNGKRFKCYKIRSMYLDADERKKQLMAQNRVSDGMMFKLDWDPRIIGNKELPDGTRKIGIGEFIRKTSLDEFPQFFNVLKGDMSLVGTRPPTPDEWEKYAFRHRARMSTKPGITGLWQVSGRSNITDFEEVVRLDTEYISNWSLGLDIKILFKTIGVVFAHKGAM